MCCGPVSLSPSAATAPHSDIHPLHQKDQNTKNKEAVDKNTTWCLRK